MAMGFWHLPGMLKKLEASPFTIRNWLYYICYNILYIYTFVRPFKILYELTLPLLQEWDNQSQARKAVGTTPAPRFEACPCLRPGGVGPVLFPAREPAPFMNEAE